jgi:hypothetical protein
MGLPTRPLSRYRLGCRLDHAIGSRLILTVALVILGGLDLAMIALWVHWIYW